MTAKKTGKLGRPKINGEKATARFPAGTLDRIDAVLDEDESLADFLRSVVLREIHRREKVLGLR